MPVRSHGTKPHARRRAGGSETTTSAAGKPKSPKKAKATTSTEAGTSPPLDTDVVTNVAQAGAAPPGAVRVGHPGLARTEALARSNKPFASRRTADAAADAAAIERCLDTPNAWSVLRKHTTKKDLHDVGDMCRRLNPERWQEIYAGFFDAVLRTQAAKPAALKARDKALPAEWFHEPFYYTYVQYFGTKDARSTSTFDDLIKMLDYLDDAGIKNVFLLPHYESPMGDGGYDVSDFAPRKDLGGEEAFERFMAEATRRGFRVATDLPLNHTSVKHKWFQAALKGDAEKLDYYLRRDGRKKVGERDENGDIVCRYQDPDGTITERVLIFPDVDREHGEVFEIGGKQVNIYQEFYPFQLDLDLENPALLDEIFKLVGDETNQGILGKRTDAIAHWIKKPGTAADGLPETHAVHALIKSFLKHVAPKAVVLPEAVRGADICAQYCGVDTEVAGNATSSEGDALFNFDMQGALREMLYFQTTTPFWEKVFRMPALPADATWLNLLEHHDETYLGMISEENRGWLGKYVEDKGGVVYKNGMSAGGRYADNLGHDADRIANAVFALYMTPGVPVMYYGTEIGAGNNPAHAARMQKKQHGIFKQLGLDVTEEQAFDPRELQRGPVPAKKFDDARAKKSPPFQTFKALNRLRAERPSVRSNLLTPVDNGHDGVLSLVKFTDDGSDTPVLALANLTGDKQTLRIPLDQLREKLGLKDGKPFVLEDLLGAGRVDAEIAGGAVRIEMPPYGRLLLDRRLA